jgi:hypothetical protein
VSKFLAAGTWGRRLFYRVRWTGYPQEDSWVSAHVLIEDMTSLAFAKACARVRQFLVLKRSDLKK